LPRLSAADPHELVKATGSRSITLLAELLLISALERTECRGPHYREDYPYRDDVNWLKWVVIRMSSGGLPVVETVPVPLSDYPVQPAQRKIIPHPIAP
ncbi:MAG: hypothetical protein HY673_25035, partial [Chloroflexi bacterium]|nr:hypothetical protein [Chloroflexota bacterium]